MKNSNRFAHHNHSHLKTAGSNFSYKLENSLKDEEEKWSSNATDNVFYLSAEMSCGKVQHVYG